MFPSGKVSNSNNHYSSGTSLTNLRLSSSITGTSTAAAGGGVPGNNNNKKGELKMVTKKKSALLKFKAPRSAFAKTKSTGSLLGGGGLSRSRSNNRISFGSASMLVYERQIENDDHKNAVWFSNEEMKDIKRDVVISIRRGDNSRGLEKYQGGDFGKQAREKRQIYTNAILTMHRDQRRFGIRDEQSIEMLSRAMSCDDMNRAQQLASMDSAHALLEHMNSLSLMPDQQQQQKQQQHLNKTHANATFEPKKTTSPTTTTATTTTSTTTTVFREPSNALLQAMAQRRLSQQQLRPGAA